MTFDRLLADHQLVGDAAVGQPVDHARQDFALALRQTLPGAGPEFVPLHAGRGVGRARRHPRVDHGVAVMGQFQLAHQLVTVDALQQVSASAHPQRLIQVLLVVVDREHHDFAMCVVFTQRLAQVQAAGALHAHIAQHHVGLQVVDDLDGAIRADGLADHLHPVLERGQHRLESFDDHLVVIDEDKSYRGRHGTTVCKLVTRIPLMGEAGRPRFGAPCGRASQGSDSWCPQLLVGPGNTDGSRCSARGDLRRRHRASRRRT